jgi:hypothetical protein
MGHNIPSNHIYAISPKIDASPTNNNGRVDKYKYYIHFNQSGEGNESQTSEWILMSHTSGTGSTFTPDDVRNYLGGLSLPCYY